MIRPLSNYFANLSRVVFIELIDWIDQYQNTLHALFYFSSVKFCNDEHAQWRWFDSAAERDYEMV
jgi:hypothetical protein